MILQSSVKLCNICLTNNGLSPPAAMIGFFSIIIPAPEGQDTISAVQAFLAGPPTPCPHVFITPEQCAASDRWADLNAKLSALPPVPTPPTVDTYATIRTRLTIDLAAALDDANNCGGLV